MSPRVRVASLLVILMMMPWFASANPVRLGGDIGLGIASVSVSGSTRNEGPGTFGIYAEYIWSSVLVVGVEHYRTLVDDDGPSSAVGFSGTYAKYFFYHGVSQLTPPFDLIDESALFVRSWNPYIGAAVGIGQSSLRSLNKSQSEGRSLSVGSYVGFRAGVEIPLRGQFTGFTEFNYGYTLVGTGAISFPRLGVGLLYSF